MTRREWAAALVDFMIVAWTFGPIPLALGVAALATVATSWAASLAVAGGLWFAWGAGTTALLRLRDQILFGSSAMEDRTQP